MRSSDTPELRICLTAEPSIRLAGHDQPINLLGLGRVLLILVTLQGSSISRAKMAQILWPGEVEGVAANRLRVSLSRLKTLLGDALVADRHHVRLAGLQVSFDVLEVAAHLRVALDEVDDEHQFELLKKQSEAIRSVAWRSFQDLDTSGLFLDFDELCRRSNKQLAETAASARDWASVDFAWQLMRDRGDMEIVVCERFLEACNARCELEAGLRRIKRAIQDLGLDDRDMIVDSLAKHAQSLTTVRNSSFGFQASHVQLIGNALLEHLATHAELLAELVSTPELQFSMQSRPTEQVQILEAILTYLEPNSPVWVDLQTTRLSAYASLYDSANVVSICKSLFPCEMTPLRASSTWMHYSFCMFQVRNWDEAFHSVRQAQEIANLGGETLRGEICRVTEAAYLWHLGEVQDARQIYDSFLERHDGSQDFTAGVNAVVVHVNYAVIEVIFGDCLLARQHIDMAYDQRERFNLSRLMPNLLSLMGLIYAKTDELHRGIDLVVKGLKLTYSRGSSREGQLNMEWASGVLEVGGFRSEALQVMNWVNTWRAQTLHTRTPSELLYAKNLNLTSDAEATSYLAEGSEYRDAMRFLIAALRRPQRTSSSPIAKAQDIPS